MRKHYSVGIAYVSNVICKHKEKTLVANGKKIRVYQCDNCHIIISKSKGETK